jgi:hypothetical protein
LRDYRVLVSAWVTDPEPPVLRGATATATHYERATTSKSPRNVALIELPPLRNFLNFSLSANLPNQRTSKSGATSS